MVKKVEPHKQNDVEKVEYGETIGFPIWFTILISVIFIVFTSYMFKNVSFDQFDQQEHENEGEEEGREEIEHDQISKKLRKKKEKKIAEMLEKERLKKEKEEKLKIKQNKQAEYDRKYNEREERINQQALEIEREGDRIYNELKSKIVIEDQGYVENLKQIDISDFIDYIKLKKRVNVEDLSAFVGLKTSSCVERINELEANDRIFGIINTQGFYLYINEEEIDEFCSFIHHIGRIHKQYDLVSACNRIFRLTSKEEDKEKIDLIYNKCIPQKEEVDP